ncbi:MAG: response regulator transcription factor [Edaphobacter sp.]
MAELIHVLLADDHPLILDGLKLGLKKDSRIRVVAQASDGATALALIQELRPDVAVIDIDMPNLSGIEVVKEVTRLQLESKIVLLTLHNDEEIFHDAMELGAKGYLLKDSAVQEIIVAVRAVAEGRLFLSSAVTAHLLQDRSAKSASPEARMFESLTVTERRILKVLASGKTSKEIGEDLSMNYRTIENHRTNICRKLKIDGTSALLRFALQHKDKF